MKKILLILALIASVCTLSSCKKENITKDENKNEIVIVDEYQAGVERTGYYAILIEYNNTPNNFSHTFSNIQMSQEIFWNEQDGIFGAVVKKAYAGDSLNIYSSHNTNGNTAKLRMYIYDEWGNQLYDTPLKTIYYSNLPSKAIITVYFD